jgi:hypothetical protein
VGSEYSVNHVFRPKNAQALGYNRLLFQLVTRKIGYLAEQLNFNGRSTELSRSNNRKTIEFVQRGKPTDG